MDLLSDKTAVVRNSAATLVVKIFDTQKFPIEKINHLSGKLLESQVWSTRLCGLTIIKTLAQTNQSMKLWEIVRSLAKDPVEVVRAEVVKMAVELSKKGMKGCLDEIVRLREDPS